MYHARKAGILPPPKAQKNPKAAPKAPEKPVAPHPRTAALMAQMAEEVRERDSKAITVGFPE